MACKPFASVIPSGIRTTRCIRFASISAHAEACGLIQVLVDANGLHSLVLLLPMLKQHPSGCPRLARAQWVINRLHTVALSLLQRLGVPQVGPEPCFLFRAECRWVSTAPRLLHAPHAVGYAHGRR